MTKRWFRLKTFLAKLSWLERIWLLMPIFIWFSYLPRIGLGGDATMNYELSLTLIYVVVLAMVGLPTIWRHRKALLKSKHIWILTAFLLWSLLSIIWSPNRLRGVLTGGILGLVYLIFLAAWAERVRLRRLLPTLAKLLVGSATIASILALIQMVVGTYIQSRDVTGLCAGCVAGQFGFVRPNLFAIEPQFFGNLLLAPILIVYYYLITHRRNWRVGLIFILLLTTLGLTLSRGAIYACAIGMVVLWLTVRGWWLAKLMTIDFILMAMVACLSIQGGLAVISPTYSETFWGAVTKSINHLSLGIIDLRPGKVDVNSEESSSASDSSTNTSPSSDEQQPAYDGYVAESTDVRVNLTKTALTAWSSQDLFHRLAGAGLGSSGVVMAQQTGSSYQKEIVQNEYVEILLERGVIGLLLFLAAIVSTFHKPHRRNATWVWSILAAYLVQWCFFSGLPNALHIYLVTSLLLIV